MSSGHRPGPDETRVARKAADQTVNNSTTLVACTDLKLAVAPNEVWAFQLFMLFSSGATPDIKFGWTVPVGATMAWNDMPSAGSHLTEVSTNVGTGLGVGSSSHKSYLGLVVMGANGGTVQLQFAQNALEASDTKVLANSHLIAWKLK